MGAYCSLDDDASRQAGMDLRDQREDITDKIILTVLTAISILGLIMILCCNKNNEKPRFVKVLLSLIVLLDLLSAAYMIMDTRIKDGAIKHYKLALRV